MSGLGGLNKAPDGVVIGLVQLQNPWVVTKDDVARQTERICQLVGKARRNMPSMDLVVFPEYALHGLSMDTNPEIMCTLDGPEVARFKQACVDHRIWGCFSIMELNPGRQPVQQRPHHRRSRRHSSLLSQDAPVGPRGAVGARRHRHPGVRRSQRQQARADHLSRRHVPRDGPRIRLPGRQRHAAHRRLHGADPACLACDQPGQRLLQSRCTPRTCAWPGPTGRSIRWAKE